MPNKQTNINPREKSTYNIPKASDEQIASAVQRKIEEERRIAEIERKKRERQDKINRTVNFLRRQGSPVANTQIASLIVDLSAANGADFRVVIAIMGIESGFCSASFNYNCFGYLNGSRYSSYTAAFQDLVPKVSRQYAARFGWNFEALAQSYGMQNWTYHAANMRKYASSI